MAAKRRTTTGIYPVHSRRCRTREDGDAKCDCTPTWQAYVPAAVPGGKPIRRNFKGKAEAKAWRSDAQVAVRGGELAAPRTRMTLHEAADELVAGMESGAVVNRSGERYRPSTVRSYREALELRVKPALGTYKMSAVTRAHVQDMVDGMLAKDAAVSTVKNTLDPLHVIYRRTIRRNLVVVDPTRDLDMPRAHERRRRAATEAHVIALLYALPDAERPLWATALCLGVRRAELRELRWSDIDFTAKVIHVTRSVDAKGEVLDPKTEAGVRDVPMLDRVYRALVAHKLATGRDGDDLVFGRTATDPFVPSTVRSRAVKAWKTAGLKPVTLHEGRHTAASVMRAAGLDIKVITEIIGHATVATTQDRYTHVSAEHLRRAAERLDAHYLAAVNE